MTLLSDSSDTETDNEEEEMIAELNHLQKSVDLGGIKYIYLIKNLFYYLPILMGICAYSQFRRRMAIRARTRNSFTDSNSPRKCPESKSNPSGR